MAKPLDNISIRLYLVGQALAGMAGVPVEDFELNEIIQKAFIYADRAIQYDKDHPEHE